MNRGSESEVGTSVPRVDGAAKVTGAAQYVDDLVVPDALHGRTLRSTVPRARLRALHLDPSFDWSRVTVVTAEDIPGENVVALIEDDQPVLVPIGGEIRHVDEALALVAAPDPATAAEALRHIDVVVEELSPVLGAEESLRAEIRLHGEDNVFKRLEIRRGDDIEEALARCDVVIDGTYRTGAQEQMYIEPQGMIAHWDGPDHCEVVGSMQCPYYVHKALKRILGLPDAAVVVRQAVTGGGFGGKEEYPSMIAAHAALLSLRAGHPVRLIYDRSEDICATTKRHPAIIHHRMGLDASGRIRAVAIDVVMDGGAYATLSSVVLSRGIIHAAGPYRIDHVHIVGRVVATNLPPYGAFRGFGAPQTTFAYERQVQKAARHLGIEPFEFRRRNTLRLGDTTATGQVLENSVGSDAVIDAVEQVASRPGRFGPSPMATAFGARDEELHRGRGLAYYFHGAGFTGSGEAFLQGRATVATLPGGDFEVRSSSTDIGQGAITIFAQIVADALGVDHERVHLAPASTDRVPDSGPTVASRTCMVVGGLVESASRQLRESLEEYAGAQGLDAQDLAAVADHRHRNVGELSTTVTYELPPGIEWDDATYTGAAYPAYGWAACLVDVAVDRDSGEVTVERCIHAVDVGKAIHPVIVEGQIEGGTLQALGWALWEHVIVEEGRVLNHRMTDCIIPTSLEAPEMETILVEIPFPHGPHGAKGVGEIPMDGPAAAVAAALEDAIGSDFDELPILPERVLEALSR